MKSSSTISVGAGGTMFENKCLQTGPTWTKARQAPKTRREVEESMSVGLKSWSWAVFLGQMVMLVIAYETGHYHPDLPDPLAPTALEPKHPADDGASQSKNNRLYSSLILTITF